MKKKTIFDLDRVGVEEYRRQPKLPLVVVADNIRSLNNIGAIFRTCDAFGVEGFLLCGISATPPSAEIHKTALGAEDSVRWRHFDQTGEAIRLLKGEGYKICCLEQVFDSVPLQDFQIEPDQKYALVLGHEVDGVSQEVVDESDCSLEIPQRGTKHSLNVSVSAGIAIWTLTRKMA